MKKYLLTGLIILLPIALTLMIVHYLFNLLTTPFVHPVERLLLAYETIAHLKLMHYDALVLFISRVIALLLLFCLILVLGYLGRKLFFDSLLQWSNRIFLRIPIVKTIYKVSKDVTKAFFSPGGKTFKQTVLVPFPHPETRALGFVTGDIPSIFKTALKDAADTVVFVPTAPHPLSGFILMTSQNKLTTVDISTEEAFKFIVSCGVIPPGQPLPES
jgi:uncharacterized membrane protein